MLLHWCASVFHNDEAIFERVVVICRHCFHVHHWLAVHAEDVPDETSRRQCTCAYCVLRDRFCRLLWRHRGCELFTGFSLELLSTFSVWKCKHISIASSVVFVQHRRLVPLTLGIVGIGVTATDWLTDLLQSISLYENWNKVQFSWY